MVNTKKTDSEDKAKRLQQLVNLFVEGRTI
jgi:hypothetical protein